MKTAKFSSNHRAFTLVEMLIVITIIALLASLTMGAFTYAMRGSKEKITRGAMEGIKSALENYHTDFAEYPEPANIGKMTSILPGKSYDIGGAACLYQALSGDGSDQIKGVSASAGAGGSAGASDGKTEGTEVANMKLKDLPQTMWTYKGGSYIIIDGFGRPFQYAKAAVATTVGGATPTATTINSTYDLWSYATDEVNISKKSIDTLKDATLSVKWIKNW